MLLFFFFFFSLLSLVCLLLFLFFIFSYIFITVKHCFACSAVLSLLCFIFSLLFINKFCSQSLKYCSCEWSACINVNIVWMHYSTFAFVTIYEYMFLMWISLTTLDQSMHDLVSQPKTKSMHDISSNVNLGHFFFLFFFLRVSVMYFYII